MKNVIKELKSRDDNLARWCRRQSLSYSSVHKLVSGQWVATCDEHKSPSAYVIRQRLLSDGLLHD